jgi:hypothetical protein
MATRKKTDVVQLSKIRMREALRAKLARDAEKKGVTLNAEIVDRLEQSYANEAKELRDSEIVDILVDRDELKGKMIRRWAIDLVKHPSSTAERIQRAYETFSSLAPDESEKVFKSSSSAEPGEGDDK